MAVVVLLGRDDPSGPRAPVGQADATIAADSGTDLAGRTFTPQSSGGHPLVVMPVPFGSQLSFYDILATRFERLGYQVVSYLQRGFHESGGQVDFAGPATQRDVSTVITWALAHTHADADHIGVLGVSYGAGMGLLAAAHDPRIRAVVALSAWTDLDESLDPNATPSTAAMRSLVDQVGDRLSPSIDAMTSTVGTAAFGPGLAGLAGVRSAQTYLPALNRNKPAIMIANGYQDSYFAPAQLLSFVAGLTTPKRLQLAPGDHGGPEAAGLTGDPDPTVDDAVAWLDHYLRGRANGVASWAPVELVDATSAKTYDSVPSDSAQPIPLGMPAPDGPVGTAAAWTFDLRSGTDSGAELGPSRLSQGGISFRPTTGALSLLTPGTFASWSGTAFTSDTTVFGAPTFHASITSSATTATVFVYVYDIAADGGAQLVVAEPYTATGLTAGTARPVTVAMQPIAWTVAAGHHLSVVVDTADARYTSPTPDGVTVTLSSTLADPVTVSVPVR